MDADAKALRVLETEPPHVRAVHAVLQFMDGSSPAVVGSAAVTGGKKLGGGGGGGQGRGTRPGVAGGRGQRGGQQVGGGGDDGDSGIDDALEVLLHMLRGLAHEKGSGSPGPGAAAGAGAGAAAAAAGLQPLTRPEVARNITSALFGACARRQAAALEAGRAAASQLEARHAQRLFELCAAGARGQAVSDPKAAALAAAAAVACPPGVLAPPNAGTARLLWGMCVGAEDEGWALRLLAALPGAMAVRGDDVDGCVELQLLVADVMEWCRARGWWLVLLRSLSLLQLCTTTTTLAAPAAVAAGDGVGTPAAPAVWVLHPAMRPLLQHAVDQLPVRRAADQQARPRVCHMCDDDVYCTRRSVMQSARCGSSYICASSNLRIISTIQKLDFHLTPRTQHSGEHRVK